MVRKDLRDWYALEMRENFKFGTLVSVTFCSLNNSFLKEPVWMKTAAFRI